MLSRLRVPKSLFLALVALLAGAAVALAAPPNGGFERGSFRGWEVDSQGGGEWSVYSGDGDPRPPKRGEFAAHVLQEGPGSNLLLRNLRLRPDRVHKLSMFLSYENFAGFHSPNSIRRPAESGAPPNQQLRVDIIRRSAGRRSLADRDVLKTLFRTRPGDDESRRWFKLRTGLTRYAGRTVVLRIAEVDNLGGFPVGVDELKVRSRRR